MARITGTQNSGRPESGLRSDFDPPNGDPFGDRCNRCGSTSAPAIGPWRSSAARRPGSGGYTLCELKGLGFGDDVPFFFRACAEFGDVRQALHTQPISKSGGMTIPGRFDIDVKSSPQKKPSPLPHSEKHDDRVRSDGRARRSQRPLWCAAAGLSGRSDIRPLSVNRTDGGYSPNLHSIHLQRPQG